MATRKDPPDREESFEAALQRLDEVVGRLERGDLPLEESLKAYEEGIGLVRQAQGRLDGMERRLEQLLADGRQSPLAGDGDRDDEDRDDEDRDDEDSDDEGEDE